MRFGTLMLVVILAGGGRGEPQNADDKRQLEELIRSFETSMGSDGDPTPYLSPNATGRFRDKEIELARKQFIEFKISGFSIDRDSSFTDPEHATLRAWLSWATPHLSTQSEESIHFEKVNGKWYFSNFDFLSFNWTLTILMSLVGVGYAIAVLTYYYHWRRQKFANWVYKYTWGTLMFTPIGWVLYPLLKPWQHAQS